MTQTLTPASIVDWQKEASWSIAGMLHWTTRKLLVSHLIDMIGNT